jgi:hypothetical protein
MMVRFEIISMFLALIVKVEKKKPTNYCARIIKQFGFFLLIITQRESINLTLNLNPCFKAGKNRNEAVIHIHLFAFS